MPYESSRADEIVDCSIAKKSMEGNGFESWVFWYVLTEDEDLATTVLGLLIGIRYGNAGDMLFSRLTFLLGCSHFLLAFLLATKFPLNSALTKHRRK